MIPIFRSILKLVMPLAGTVLPAAQEEVGAIGEWEEATGSLTESYREFKGTRERVQRCSRSEW
jgi:hypothetical protein